MRIWNPLKVAWLWFIGGNLEYKNRTGKYVYHVHIYSYEIADGTANQWVLWAMVACQHCTAHWAWLWHSFQWLTRWRHMSRLIFQVIIEKIYIYSEPAQHVSINTLSCGLNLFYDNTMPIYIPRLDMNCNLKLQIEINSTSGCIDRYFSGGILWHKIVSGKLKVNLTEYSITSFIYSPNIMWVEDNYFDIVTKATFYRKFPALNN